MASSSNIKVNDIGKIVVEGMRFKNVKYKFTNRAKGWTVDAMLVLFNVNKKRQFRLNSLIYFTRYFLYRNTLFVIDLL